LPELKRTPKDLDFIGPGENSKGIEYFMHTGLQYVLDNNIDDTYVDLNFLYTIKCSHLHYDINWDKHCIDVMFMQSHGATIDNTLYSLLMKDWEVIHGPKKLNLNQDPKDFFTPHVDRKIDHDELHSLIAFYDEPMFKKILMDGKKVLTDKHKWDRISDEDKMICILEEVYVTAFERWPSYPDMLVEKIIMQTVQNHPRTSNFVQRGKVMTFRELPQTAQDALIHYMSVDGAAWAVSDGWEDWKWGEGQPFTLEVRAEVLSDIEKFRDRFIEEYGNTKFGYVIVPYEELIEAVNGDDVFNGESRKYEPWTCMQEGACTKIKGEYDVPTWPVILSEFHDETLQDGWNRLANYCKQKLPVPVVWYE